MNSGQFTNLLARAFEGQYWIQSLKFCHLDQSQIYTYVFFLSVNIVSPFLCAPLQDRGWGLLPG